MNNETWIDRLMTAAEPLEGKATETVGFSRHHQCVTTAGKAGEYHIYFAPQIDRKIIELMDAQWVDFTLDHQSTPCRCRW